MQEQSYILKVDRPSATLAEEKIHLNDGGICVAPRGWLRYSHAHSLHQVLGGLDGIQDYQILSQSRMHLASSVPSMGMIEDILRANARGCLFVLSPNARLHGCRRYVYPLGRSIEIAPRLRAK